MPRHQKKISYHPTPLFIISLIIIGIGFILVGWKWFKDSSARTLGLSTQSVPAGSFYKSLTNSYSEWNFETSGTAEKITTTSNGWILQAGGNVASTHYARIKYKLPERVSLAPTTFYMKSVVELPSDFFTQQKASLRVMTTDNYPTAINGVYVGATTIDELRTAVYIDTTHHWRILATHENHPTKTLWLSTAPISTGSHVLEFFGSVSEVAPWYFKVDGVTLASGISRLSPDTVPVAERVITRMIAGIDGAASQDYQSMYLTVNNFEIADHNPSTAPVPTAVITTAPTFAPPTSVPPTAAPTPTPVGDNTPPVISVSSPLSGALIVSNLYFSAKASDASGIKSIEFWFDAKKIKTCFSSTCSTTQKFNNLAPGSHTVTVYATDKSANKNKAKTTILVTK